MTVDDSSSIYVGGISYNATEETLRRAFHIYGSVVAVKIINDQAVGGKCYGFVTFKNPRSAMHAIDEMDGRAIEGRVVRVNQVKTRGGRTNFGRENFRQNFEGGAGGNRSRSREKLQERGPGGDRSRSRERPYERGAGGDRSRSQERLYQRGAGGDRSRSQERLYQRGAVGGRSRSPERLYQRGAGGDRSRSRERVNDYNRDLRMDAQREQLQNRDQYRNRGLCRLRDQNRNLEHMASKQPEVGYIEREHDRNHEQQDWENNNKNDMARDRPEMGYVESEHDRNHEQDWDNNNKNDMETSRDLGRYQNNDSGTDERPNSVDGFSRDIHSDREFSSKSRDRHDEVERQLEVATQKVEDLQQEITAMEKTAEEKKHALLKLQEKVQTLKDAVTASRKLKSHRQIQLTELQKCHGQVKEYNEKLKKSEQDLQSLVDSTNLEDEL